MKELLPVGTVVRINDNEELKLMVGGYYPLDKELNISYDYFGLIYPYGITLHKKVMMFNHIDISAIEFLGYSTKDSKSALLHLKEMKK